MKSKNINCVNTNLDFETYVFLVKAIAKGFWNDKLEYTPDVGKLHAMRLFYYFCVREDINNIPHPEVFSDFSIDDSISLASNDHFIDLFDDAIKCRGNRFDFANAYKDGISTAEFKATQARESAIIEAMSSAFESVFKA